MRTKHSCDLALLHVTHCNSCNCWEQNTEIPLYIGLFQQLFRLNSKFTPCRLVRITPLVKSRHFFFPLLPAFLYNQSNQPINRAHQPIFISAAVSASQKSLFCRVKQCLYTLKHAFWNTLQFRCLSDTFLLRKQAATNPAIYFVCITPSNNKFCCIKYRVSSSFPMIPTR